MNPLGNQDFNPYKHLETGKNRENIAADKAYDKKKNTTAEDTKKLQEEARKGLFGDFKVPEVHTTEENCQDFIEGSENLDLKKHLEQPITPILERFSGDYTSEEIQVVETFLNTKGSQKEVLNSLSDLSNDLGDNETTKTEELKQYVDRVMNTNIKQKETKEQSGEKKTELPKEFKNNDFLEKNKDSQITQLLAENYLEIPSDNGDTEKLDSQSNFQDNLQLTFEITVNKVIEGKQFERTDAFMDAMKDIKNDIGNIKEKFQALKYINSLVQTSEGRKGKRGLLSIESVKKMEKEYSSSKNEYYREKIKSKIESIEDKEIKELIMSQPPEKLLEQKVLSPEVQNILQEIKELNEKRTSGDTFEAGDIDKSSESIQESKDAV